MIILYYDQEFARKLLQLDCKLSTNDILEEVQAAVLFDTSGGHKNIVALLRHGWFPGNVYYYIDMELCSFNLDDFIRGGLTDSDDIKRLLGKALDSWIISQESKAQLKFETLISIMSQISCGMEFIHNCNAVHRDLKPSNVILPLFIYLQRLTL